MATDFKRGQSVVLDFFVFYFEDDQMQVLVENSEACLRAKGFW